MDVMSTVFLRFIISGEKKHISFFRLTYDKYMIIYSYEWQFIYMVNPRRRYVIWERTDAENR